MYFKLFYCIEDLFIFRGTFVDEELVNSSEEGKAGWGGGVLDPRKIRYDCEPCGYRKVS
jgi:hypothetical protein